MLHGKGLPPRKSGTRYTKKEGVISMAQGCIFPLFFCSYFLQMNEEELEKENYRKNDFQGVAGVSGGSPPVRT